MIWEGIEKKAFFFGESTEAGRLIQVVTFLLDILLSIKAFFFLQNNYYLGKELTLLVKIIQVLMKYETQAVEGFE